MGVYSIKQTRSRGESSGPEQVSSNEYCIADNQDQRKLIVCVLYKEKSSRWICYKLCTKRHINGIRYENKSKSGLENEVRK